MELNRKEFVEKQKQQLVMKGSIADALKYVKYKILSVKPMQNTFVESENTRKCISHRCHSKRWSSDFSGVTSSAAAVGVGARRSATKSEMV